MPRPFRVDEDWNVIYLDEEQGGALPAGRRNAGEQNRAGIMSWEEPTLGAAGAIGGGHVGYELGEDIYDFLHRYFR